MSHLNVTIKFPVPVPILITTYHHAHTPAHRCASLHSCTAGTSMANPASLAAAKKKKEKKEEADAETSAQVVTHLQTTQVRSSNPLSSTDTPLLDFPGSDTPVEPLSDQDDTVKKVQKNKLRPKQTPQAQPKAILADVVVMIPEAISTGNQLVPIGMSTSFEDAVELMYGTFGCVRMSCKPMLAYNLPSAKVKDATVSELVISCQNVVEATTIPRGTYREIWLYDISCNTYKSSLPEKQLNWM
ncbi:hypothetical protein FB451DRAFT_1168350 [Mycena latifolia]|nr:hypothetical protein FB451DRAFT_1168350 [Mycena latifolia]